MYRVRVIEPIADSGSSQAPTTREISRKAPRTAMPVPRLTAMARGVLVCGASTASDHQVSVGSQSSPQIRISSSCLASPDEEASSRS